MPDPLYAITASLPDGVPYTDSFSQALLQAGMEPGAASATVYTDAERDQYVAAIEAAGLTPHIGPAS